MIDDQSPLLTAYIVSEQPLRLELAPGSRQWMEETSDRFAKRCLPMLLANYGWWIVTTVPFQAMWNGGIDKSSITITSPSGNPVPAISHFGHGILTIPLNWLFRTSQEYNLLFRGPSNFFKDGASALEGLVETSWASATATMNWKLTRPGLWVTWEANEPIAQLVPQKRGELESFQTHMQSINDEPEILEAYTAWSQGRSAFLNDLKVPGSEACKREWQKDYFQGKGVSEHQTKLKLAAFTQEEGSHS